MELFVSQEDSDWLLCMKTLRQEGGESGTQSKGTFPKGTFVSLRTCQRSSESRKRRSTADMSRLLPCDERMCANETVSPIATKAIVRQGRDTLGKTKLRDSRGNSDISTATRKPAKSRRVGV